MASGGADDFHAGKDELLIEPARRKILQNEAKFPPGCFSSCANFSGHRPTSSLSSRNRPLTMRPCRRAWLNGIANTSRGFEKNKGVELRFFLQPNPLGWSKPLTPQPSHPELFRPAADRLPDGHIIPIKEQS